MDRAIIARVETDNRGISLDEAILFAAALGTSLENMIVPSDVGVPGLIADGPNRGEARSTGQGPSALAQGLQPLRMPEDLGAWFKAMPDGDLRAFLHFGMQPVAQAMHSLIEALGVDYDLD